MKLGRIFTSQSCSDGKEMYAEKACCAWKVVFFANLSLLVLFFLPFMLSLLSWSLLKLPIVHKGVCFVNDVNKTITFLERK